MFLYLVFKIIIIPVTAITATLMLVCDKLRNVVEVVEVLRLYVEK